ncbi:MAG: phosphoribosylanthranilate isomerase [Cyclobacteriaceae bacterium]
MDFKLKVCGMRDHKNIGDLISLRPDFIGFIFYEKSPRFIGDNNIPEIPDSIQKVGVFVNESKEFILAEAQKYSLKFIQLHGDESVELVQELKLAGLSIIKVFSVMDEMPVERIRVFENFVDYFLFDTKTSAYGGSGNKFNWSILKQYDSKVPFFLSGGITTTDIPVIKSLELNQLYAIDVNSKFEVSPGLKDIQKLEILKEEL